MTEQDTADMRTIVLTALSETPDIEAWPGPRSTEITFTARTAANVELRTTVTVSVREVAQA